MSEYRLVVIPDVISPDGSVRPGKLGRLVLLEHRKAVRDSLLNMQDRAMGPGFKPADYARWDMLQAALKEIDQRLAGTL